MKRVKINNWEYGRAMLKQGDISSLEEWTNDKEYCCSVMDKEYDYLWDFNKGIHFIDRLYSEYKDKPNINKEYIDDETMKKRIEKNEAELWFNDFNEVKQFIKEKEHIGKSIYEVYGDDFIEPIKKEHGIIKEKKDGYFIAENDKGIEISVFIDETFNNMDFNKDIGTEYRVFTDENDANKYYEYLKSKGKNERKKNKII